MVSGRHRLELAEDAGVPGPGAIACLSALRASGGSVTVRPSIVTDFTLPFRSRVNVVDTEKVAMVTSGAVVWSPLRRSARPRPSTRTEGNSLTSNDSTLSVASNRRSRWAESSDQTQRERAGLIAVGVAIAPASNNVTPTITTMRRRVILSWLHA